MHATAAQPSTTVKLPGRRYDHWFFSITAWLMLATVFLGFAHTYYLAGVFHAPLPSFIIHVHGAVFSSWILLLIAQTTLVSAGRTDIHRKLGIAGFCLACLMVILGILAGANALVRGFTPPGLDAKTFYIVQVTDMLIFAALVFFAFRLRRNSPAHKRLIFIATTGLLLAAVARWPIPGIQGNVMTSMPVTYIFLVALAIYDFWSTRKVHRATIWASAFLIIVQQIRVPIGFTAPWHHFADWVISIAS
jgi:hypothetical protein